MGERRVKPKNRKPTFFWQGVLILAPMLVLAKLGALALWQDKRMAQHEATLRAQDAAEEAAQLIWNDLQKFDSRTKRIDIDRAGRLVLPPPYEATPAPQPLDSRALSEAQRTAWDEARAQGANAGAAGEAYRQFLNSSPPTNFAAAAHCALGDLLAQANEFSMAIDEFSTVTNGFPNSLSEAGVPLDTLARFKIFEAQRGLGILRHEDEVRNASDDLLRHVIKHPSALTPEILRRIPAMRMMPPITNQASSSGVGLSWMTPSIPEDLRFKAEAEWKEHERLREIYAVTRLLERPAIGLRSTTNAFAFAPLPPAPAVFWITLRTHRTIEPTPQPEKELPPRKSESEAREPEPPPLTPVWSNVMQREHRDRGKELAVNASQDNGVWHQGGWLTFDEPWLLVRTTNETTTTLFCRDEAAASTIAAAALQRMRMPEYLAASARVADRDLISSNSLSVLEHIVSAKGGGQFWKRSKAATMPAVLASATRGDNGQPLLAVSIHLISPELLYTQQEERATLFKLLIGASALASIIGFFTAWRAFHKQLRLAEMKSNFVSSVSHELRAPIASVRLMAEGLERGKVSEPSKQQEYFRFITQECRRLSSMIENVLDFARIEQGRKQYEFEPTDITALVEKTVQLMEPYAAERVVKLTNVSPASVRAPAIEDAEIRQDAKGTLAANIDGQAVQQALVNLIDNAIKHSPADSEVLVGLTLNPQLSTLNLSVADRGPGIPAGEQEKIFERFYRLGSELRRETPGVGIGLSIVKHVVEAHGGRVRVESEVGQGSRFTIELPMNHQGTKAPKE